MFHISIGWGAGPNVQKRAKRLLNEAMHELLDSEKMVEDCTAQRDALKRRVERLVELCKPAPTENVDGVAKGDITLQTPVVMHNGDKGVATFVNNHIESVHSDVGGATIAEIAQGAQAVARGLQGHR